MSGMQDLWHIIRCREQYKSAKHTIRFVDARHAGVFNKDIAALYSVSPITGHYCTCPHINQLRADERNVQPFAVSHFICTVFPKKYAHGFVVLCLVAVMQSFIMNSHEVFIYIHQGCFTGTGAIIRLPQCQWSKPVGYGKISQCLTTTKHSKAKTVCIFLGIYCILSRVSWHVRELRPVSVNIHLL